MKRTSEYITPRFAMEKRKKRPFTTRDGSPRDTHPCHDDEPDSDTPDGFGEVKSFAAVPLADSTSCGRRYLNISRRCRPGTRSARWVYLRLGSRRGLRRR